MLRTHVGAAGLPPTPSLTASSSRSTLGTSGSEAGADGVRGGGVVDDGHTVHRSNTEALLARSSGAPKDLVARLERQRDEIRLLQEENVRLKAREVEVSGLVLRLQQHFSATQSQVERIKAQIHLQLANPITEAEYQQLDSLPESQRDLLITVKLGIFRQLNAMRASCAAATARATQLERNAAAQAEQVRELQQKLTESEAMREAERAAAQTRLQRAGQDSSRVAELETAVREMEARLRARTVDQESFLSAKLTAQAKTDEAAKLGIRVEELEMERERCKADAACSEEKLSILKSEYYELKLQYNTRVLELETALKAADEKLQSLADLELESELFLANLAGRQAETVTGQPTERGDEGGVGPAGDPSSYETWLALPRSRKLAHTLVVTKRCLQLENRLAVLQQDIEFKDKQLSRLQVSLEAARDALHQRNNPYALVEKTVASLSDENELLRTKVCGLEHENSTLRSQLRQRTTDVQLLCKHRTELLRMKQALSGLGISIDGPSMTSRNGGSEPPEAVKLGVVGGGTDETAVERTRRDCATRRTSVPVTSSLPSHGPLRTIKILS